MTEYVMLRNHVACDGKLTVFVPMQIDCNVHEDCQGSKQDMLEAEAYYTYYLCLFLPAGLQDVA